MAIHSRSINVEFVPSLEIAGRKLQNVSKYEYLGVIMDDKLNMNNHIEHVTKKVKGKLSILRKLRRHITEDFQMSNFMSF